MLLADVVLIIHFLWILTVIVPVPLIVLGKYRGWAWVRNFKFRVIHLCMIAIVTLEAVVGMICPLTELESLLRRQSGQHPYEGTFVEHWLSRLLFYDFEPWVFMLAYSVFCGIVIFLFWWVAPRHK